MSNDYRNSEGYPDPTAGEALSRIASDERKSLRAFRPIVYVCSPYSGDVDANVGNARRYCRFAVDKGMHPHSAAPSLPAVPRRQRRGGTRARPVLRKRAHEQVRRGLGVRQPHLARDGIGDQTRQVEGLPLALFHRRMSGGLTPCTK